MILHLLFTVFVYTSLATPTTVFSVFSYLFAGFTAWHNKSCCHTKPYFIRLTCCGCCSHMYGTRPGGVLGVNRTQPRLVPVSVICRRSTVPKQLRNKVSVSSYTQRRERATCLRCLKEMGCVAWRCSSLTSGTVSLFLTWSFSERRVTSRRASRRCAPVTQRVVPRTCQLTRPPVVSVAKTFRQL